MRALSGDERLERQDQFADHAVALFQEKGYSGLTVEALAKRAGVAKGSVFLFFASKEDIFLHATRRRFESWVRRLAVVDPAAGSARELAITVARSLRDDPSLIPLMAIVGSVLEQGSSAAAVLDFKLALLKALEGLVTVWAPRLPAIPGASWLPFFLRTYALIVGAWSVGEPSKTVKEIVAANKGLEVFVPGFDALFLPLLEAQIAAFRG